MAEIFGETLSITIRADELLDFALSSIGYELVDPSITDFSSMSSYEGGPIVSVNITVVHSSLRADDGPLRDLDGPLDDESALNGISAEDVLDTEFVCRGCGETFASLEERSAHIHRDHRICEAPRCERPATTFVNGFARCYQHS